MLRRTKAAIKVFLSSGRVPVFSATTCPYCGKTHSDQDGSGLGIDKRPILSLKGNLLCRGCSRRLDDEECESCDRDFEEQGGDE